MFGPYEKIVSFLQRLFDDYLMIDYVAVNIKKAVLCFHKLLFKLPTYIWTHVPRLPVNITFFVTTRKPLSAFRAVVRKDV